MAIEEEVLNRLKSVKGIINAFLLSQEDIDKVREFEIQAEKNKAAGGMMDFINEGVWEVLSKSAVFLIFIDETFSDRKHGQSLTLMKDPSGNILGKLLRKDEIPEYQKRNDVLFMGEEFVIFTNVKTQGKPYFVIPSQKLEELNDLNGISASLCVPTDLFFKQKYNIKGENLGTVLIGVDKP
ncbi:MAG: hypothetical protein APG12_00347 [Candidatus Methanofastidiosum methylothiophilum]|uniref:Uncharacterized protein n=1 Tax=Candidatus Methanofastidiosum methylothiophilum TaxID=1705564 RepID=A0A150IMR8_9EURY|nr:MAG: hypothetical protein APG10_00191 [Candidatus Methanofastidiosum methylthiophilus]KYC48426.1 MAG: hypothetical protein APG11_00339 [Candidatus Methanofastidiosum methylthiophilus]KYC51062.1 MAG: hypothetical protein APG12_00347 [Candidatus Methanofastidiosum methylthiophilus]